MSILVFYVGENGYGIDSSHILRIIPQVELQKMVAAPACVAGLLNLEGRLIPIIDFCLLIEQRTAQHLLSSRIILIKDSQPGSENILGILGENVKHLVNIRSEEFSPIDFTLTPFPFLNRFVSYGHQIIQYLNVEEFFRFISADLPSYPEIWKQ